MRRYSSGQQDKKHWWVNELDRTRREISQLELKRSKLLTNYNELVIRKGKSVLNEELDARLIQIRGREIYYDNLQTSYQAHFTGQG